ncbi:hypothetical protein MRX96_003260 [Rhipicephalus microplus]
MALQDTGLCYGAESAAGWWQSVALTMATEVRRARKHTAGQRAPERRRRIQRTTMRPYLRLAVTWTSWESDMRGPVRQSRDLDQSGGRWPSCAARKTIEVLRQVAATVDTVGTVILSSAPDARQPCFDRKRKTVGVKCCGRTRNDHCCQLHHSGPRNSRPMPTALPHPAHAARKCPS